MSKIFLCAAILSFYLCGPKPGLTSETYRGSLPEFLTLLAYHHLSDLVLPEWSSGARIDYFDVPDGKRLRYAYWPHAGARQALGTVVHFNGRTEFIERNILTYRDLAQKGWDVWTLDWRGQGLSYRQLEGDLAVRGHINDFATYVGDAANFIDKTIRLQERPGLHVLLAHSMGGQVALRFLLDHPTAFDRVVMSSPLVGLPGGWITAADEILKDVLSMLPQVTEGCVPGRADQWVGSFKESACSAIADLDNHPLPDPKDSTQSMSFIRDPAAIAAYTHDPRNVAVGECLVEESRRNSGTPGLAVACPTGGWLIAAQASTEYVRGEHSKLTMPILIVGAENDTAVDPRAEQALCDRLPHCAFVSVPNAGHELLIEKPDVRKAFLGCFDAFVDDASGGAAACRKIVRNAGIQ